MIVYLHGFARNNNCIEAKSLKDHFGKELVFAPNLPVNPNDVAEILTSAALPRDIIFVGSSLGGFWANWAAQWWASKDYNTHAILINPSTRPSKRLAKYVGRTRAYSPDYIPVTQLDLGGYLIQELWLDENFDPARISLFLAQDDDVINANDTLKELPLDDHAHLSFLKVEPTGGHSFSEHWNQVINRIEGLQGKK